MVIRRNRPAYQRARNLIAVGGAPSARRLGRASPERGHGERLISAPSVAEYARGTWNRRLGPETG